MQVEVSTAAGASTEEAATGKLVLFQNITD
jgi:hypothetical protein